MVVRSESFLAILVAAVMCLPSPASAAPKPKWGNNTPQADFNAALNKVLAVVRPDALSSLVTDSAAALPTFRYGWSLPEMVYVSRKGWEANVIIPGADRCEVFYPGPKYVCFVR